VQILESGLADGHAYELMEYCIHGSLRDLMQAGPLAGATLVAMIRSSPRRSTASMPAGWSIAT
jgi:hypothetical protein